MEYIKIMAEGKTLEFECEASGTRNGFMHSARLYVDGEYTGAHTAHYLNRTWEAYTYQSVCSAIVRARLQEAVDDVRREWMDARGYKRMTAARRAEWRKYPAGDDARVMFWQTVCFVLHSCMAGGSLNWQAGARERAILQDLGNVTRTGRQCYKIENAAGTRFCLFHLGRSEFVG